MIYGDSLSKNELSFITARKDRGFRVPWRQVVKGCSNAISDRSQERWSWLKAASHSNAHRFFKSKTNLPALKVNDFCVLESAKTIFDNECKHELLYKNKNKLVDCVLRQSARFRIMKASNARFFLLNHPQMINRRRCWKRFVKLIMTDDNRRRVADEAVFSVRSLVVVYGIVWCSFASNPAGNNSTAFDDDIALLVGRHRWSELIRLSRDKWAFLWMGKAITLEIKIPSRKTILRNFLPSFSERSLGIKSQQLWVEER